jgi:8-oxo-dGTP pyrophosphatase MutT (NUDIX family)
MTLRITPARPARTLCALVAAVLLLAAPLAAQVTSAQYRDPAQVQDTSFARVYREWLPNQRLGSPLVDHLPIVPGIPTPRDVLGYHIGAPKTLTYYADQLRYYRALAAATPRVRVETIGRSDEGRELVVVWVSSEANMARLDANRANLARLADPRGASDADIAALIRTTKPHYHLMGGLHSGELGPPEMLMELVYRLATETSEFITNIRDNLYVSVTPAADADGRDRNLDWFYQNHELGLIQPPRPPGDTTGGPRQNPSPIPYWGKYVYHDNNRDINLSQVQMRALADWYFTAHPPIMHDLHESLPLLYTYSGAMPQNPNLDPTLFTELPFFANWELAQLTRFGMPGVYTHAFMDGWSPGYLGSIAYNHNGMMRMYETQSGRDLDAGQIAAVFRRPLLAPDSTPPLVPRGSTGRGGLIPTGRGGAQEREWYRGIPIEPLDSALFTRRANTNYMQTGVLSGLQLAAMFPEAVLENFSIRTRHSIEAGTSRAPYAYVIPVQRDMTRAADLVNILRVQRIEVGQAARAFRAGGTEYPAGSYVVKLNQPYGRLAKNLLEVQHFPDDRLNTYDDSGWTMGYAMGLGVDEIKDPSVLTVSVTPVEQVAYQGRVTGHGTAGIAIAHLGSNNMITFRYRLRNVPMRVAKAAFRSGGVEFPAGSFIVTDMTHAAAVRAAAEELGLTGAMLTELPSVAMHASAPPRVAIYSQWGGTQNLGWYRHAFDRFGVPFDLIYKERVMAGDLRRDYDVILLAEQNLSRQTVMQAKGATPVPYQQTEKYRFLGMYGESPDVTGGFGQAGVDAFAAFLEAGGTLLATGDATLLPIQFGWAGTVDRAPVEGLFTQRPLLTAEIVRTDHPVFYGYAGQTIPVKYVGGQPLRVGVAHEGNVLARYVGGNDSLLSGLMTGGDGLRHRPFVVDIPEAHRGKGRVILYSNNPIYRWQNHGEFNMIFNAVLNWDHWTP